MSTLERAIAIAVEAHAGQKDKADAPYILHPLRVMLLVEGTAARMAAVLHDVVEDSDWTLERLRAEGFAPEVLSAIEAVTKRSEEEGDYDGFIRRAGQHPIGRIVKLADLADNLDVTRFAVLTDKDRARLEKYERARAMLEGTQRPGG